MANLSNINGKFVVEQTTGYVGVGTTDPNYPIEVLNASAEIALNASGGSIYRLRSDSTDSFRINKNGVGDRLVIDGSGNSTFAGNVTSTGVNITNVTPTSEIIIESNTLSLVQLKDTDLNKVYNIEIGRSSTAGDLTFRSSGGEKVRFTEAGNVGINTDDPQTKLHSNGGSSDSDILWSIMTNNTSNAAATGFGSGIKFKNALFSNAIEQNKWAGIAGVAETSYSNTMAMVFYTPSNVATSAPQERMRINASGNVGIGETSPSGALHVKSSTATTTGMVRLQNDMDNNYETLRVESLGNYDAHIGFLANGTSAYWWGIGIDYSDSGKFKISGDNLLSVNTRLTIDTSGNVGIGTASPSQKLDVQGNVNINGTVVEEGSGNNKTYRYRTPNSNSYSGGNALITFGRFYWTPAHWVDVGPVLEVTLQCKYYSGYQRKYTLIKTGYAN